MGVITSDACRLPHKEHGRNGSLRACLKTGRYTLLDENFVLKNRLDKRQRLDWVKKQAVVEPPLEAESCQTVSNEIHGQSLHDFWTWGKPGELVRIHRRPRESKFTPIGVGDVLLI